MCAMMPYDNKNNQTYFFEAVGTTRPGRTNPPVKLLLSTSQILMAYPDADNSSKSVISTFPNREVDVLIVHTPFDKLLALFRETAGIAENKDGVLRNGSFFLLHDSDCSPPKDGWLFNRHFINLVSEGKNRQASIYYYNTEEPCRVRETYDEVKSLLMAPH